MYWLLWQQLLQHNGQNKQQLLLSVLILTSAHLYPRLPPLFTWALCLFIHLQVTPVLASWLKWRPQFLAPLSWSLPSGTLIPWPSPGPSPGSSLHLTGLLSWALHDTELISKSHQMEVAVAKHISQGKREFLSIKSAYISRGPITHWNLQEKESPKKIKGICITIHPSAPKYPAEHAEF